MDTFCSAKNKWKTCDCCGLQLKENEMFANYEFPVFVAHPPGNSWPVPFLWLCAKARPVCSQGKLDGGLVPARPARGSPGRKQGTTDVPAEDNAGDDRGLLCLPRLNSTFQGQSAWKSDPRTNHSQ